MPQKTRFDIKKPANLLPVVPPELKCEFCGGMGFVGQDLPYHHPDFGKAIRCPSRYHNEENLKRIEPVTNLSLSDYEFSLEDFSITEKNKAFFMAMGRAIKDPGSLGWVWAWGGNGCGKSDAFKAVIKEFAVGKGKEHGMIGGYFSLWEILLILKETYSPDSKYSLKQQYDKIVNLPVLIIDEFDKKTLSTFDHETMFNFLNQRYVQAKRDGFLTIFGSNKAPEDVLPPDIMTRLSEFTTVYNQEVDFRPTVKKNKELNNEGSN